jgi:hypothetical protein
VVAPVVVAALAAGFAVPVGVAPTAAAADGLSLGPVRTVPGSLVPSDPGVVSGTGTRFIAAGESEASPWYTPDDGRTWRPVPEAFARAAVLYGRGESAIGYQGSFVGIRTTEPGDDFAFTGIQRWDPDTGAVTTAAYDLGIPPNPEAEGFYPVDYVGSTVVLNDGRIFDISGTTAVLLHPAFATTPQAKRHTYGLGKDQRTAVRASLTDEAGYLSVAPLDGNQGTPSVKVRGLLAMDVSADTIHYLTGTSHRLRLCKAATVTPARAACTTVASGDFRPTKYAAELSTSAGADQILTWKQSNGAVRQYFVQGGRAVRVPSSWTWLPFRDAVRPMAIAPSKATRLDMTSTVDTRGVATPLFSSPKVPAYVWDLLVSTGRLTLDQDYYSPSVGMTRGVFSLSTGDDGTFSSAVKVARTDGSSEFPSAARTAVQFYRPARARTVSFYDGTTKTRSVTVRNRVHLRGLSGPYALLTDRVVRVDGHAYPTTHPVAQFGSLVVEASSGKEVAGRTFTVRDLARPTAAPIGIALPQVDGRIFRNGNWWMWGEWVVLPYRDPDQTYGWIALNYRTGVSRVFGPEAGEVQGIGDGWVLLRTEDDSGVQPARALMKLLTTGGEFRIDAAQGCTSVSTDGIRTIGWTGKTSKVAEAQGLPVSPPRLLGALAPSSLHVTGSKRWKAQFDLTKAVAGGTLEIRNVAGTLVRSLTTTADTMGSLRGVSWDGRDSAGRRVPAGSYTWTLNVPASDGSGTAVSVDGSGAAVGTVTVKR